MEMVMGRYGRTTFEVASFEDQAVFDQRASRKPTG